MSISRRDALARIGSVAAVAAGTSLVARWRWDRGLIGEAKGAQPPQVRDFRASAANPTLPEIVIARGDPDPSALTSKALAAMGGMSRFISRGDVVVVKPNIGWDRAPVHAANTNPDVVGAVVKAAFEAGAKTVVVTDVSCNEANRCFQRSGIWKKAYDLGADVILPADHRFRNMRLRGELLDEWPIFTPLVNADKVINVPVAKHHNLAKYTGAMKNWYGILGGRRNRLHQNINVSIADLSTFMRPTLTVVDATRVLVRNGPQGGNIDDTVEMNTVIASVDQVAADAFACTLIGAKPENVPYLQIATDRGIGTLHWKTLRIKEV
jgi:uncharacterized protein (DUF362 family)